MVESLSFWHLILNASLVVKLVMIVLLMASVISWAMIIQRAGYFNKAYDELLIFEDEFWSGSDLSDLYKSGNDRLDTDEITGIELVFRSGYKEFSRLNDQEGIDPNDVLAGTERAMRITLSREEEELEKHLSFLANVGSAAPYVGLLGTVWGVMNSFRGLANTHQATLASVAPGISEALIATAMGLFAAIPAVIAYNRFSSKVNLLLNRYENFVDEFSGILLRQIHISQK